MATVEGNRRVAALRGTAWRGKLMQGRLDSQLNPTALKLKRVQKQISQDELADLIGLSLSTYGQIERGLRTLTKETASKLSKAVGASQQSLFSQNAQGKWVATRNHA